MARPIVLSNGNLHVGLNADGLVHDFYYPYVGLENHAAGAGTIHRVGVWVDGNIHWVDAKNWHLTFQTADRSLVGHVTARNDDIGLLLEIDSFVSTDVDAFCRAIRVINLRPNTRDVRIFMHQAFVIGDGRSNRDTAQYLPDSDAILHYRGNRVFVISSKQPNNGSFDQHSIGLFGIENREGTYRDADDGELSNGLVEHGRVDSTIRNKLTVAGHDSVQVEYWIACGTTLRDALSAHKHVQETGLHAMLETTSSWWHDWLAPSEPYRSRLASSRSSQFSRSLMTIKSHIDNRGALIASTDTTMLNYSRDAYGYCWPRDGAFVLWPLIRMGFYDEPRNFFDFCVDALHPNGYLMHKYQADGSLGSSWHPYVHGDVQAPPIQEDETALVLFMVVQFAHMHDESALVQRYYDTLIRPMADFLAGCINDESGLPRPSYDLWEERFLTSTYTTAVTYGALCAASDIAERAGDQEKAVAWKNVADDIRLRAQKRLFNHDRSAFYKGLASDLTPDPTIDISSFYGAFMFGLFDVTGDEVTNAASTIRSLFDLDSTLLLPRYENDEYHRTDTSIPGNYWFITSLWYSQYAREVGDNDLAERILTYVEANASPTGMFSEQLDPNGNRPVSVSPLIWSHAEYLATVLDTFEHSGAKDV